MTDSPPVTDDEYQNYVEQCEQIGKKPLSRESYGIMVKGFEVITE